MAASSRKSSGPVLRSLSPSPRFHNPHSSSSSSSFASSSSSFFNRPISPTRVNLSRPYTSCSSIPSVRFSTSPSRSISVTPRGGRSSSSQVKRTCMCSPTSHPGSFRCSLHKNYGSNNKSAVAPYSPNRLNARRSAMTNSVVRIGGVEGGDLVKRALAALIRPSSHQQRRRGDFRPRPSRLSVMSKAGYS